MIDPIVEEIHKTRREYAAEFDYDIEAMFEDLRQKQSNGDAKIVSFAKAKKKQSPEEKKVA